MISIGVISDTHGLIREQALTALEGSDLILHAGDIGGADILEPLSRLAPVRAVRGNIDKGAWAETLPLSDVVEVKGKYLYLVHNIDDLNLDPAGQFDAVIYGHSHKPYNALKDDVLYFNPGSAGPRRFSLPIAMGRIIINDHGLVGEVIELDVPKSR